MRLKHFLEQMAKLDGWRLEDVGNGPEVIRRYEVANCECPLIAVGRVAIPCLNLDMSVYCFKSVSLCLNLPPCIAAASDNFMVQHPHATENLLELREHLLRAARIA